VIETRAALRAGLDPALEEAVHLAGRGAK
jgi:hypothetical protein